MQRTSSILTNSEDFDSIAYYPSTQFHWRSYFTYTFAMFTGPAMTIDLGQQTLVNHVLLRPAWNANHKNEWTNAFRMTLSRDDETHFDLAAIHDVEDVRLKALHREIPLLHIGLFGPSQYAIGRYLHMNILEEQTGWAMFQYLDVYGDSYFNDGDETCPTGFERLRNGCYKMMKPTLVHKDAVTVIF